MLQKILDIRVSELDKKWGYKNSRTIKDTGVRGDGQVGEGAQQGMKRISDLREMSRVRTTEHPSEIRDL